jgi:hypothetical protein
MRLRFVKDYGSTICLSCAFCSAVVAGIADPGRDMRISETGINDTGYNISRILSLIPS